VNPRDLGIEADSFDDVKQRLSESDNLRQEVEQLRNQPKTVFANETIAGYNEFLKQHPKVENYGFYQKLVALTPDDPAEALTAKYILQNPQYIGQEEKVKNHIMKEYKIDASLYTPEEVEFNLVRAKSEAENFVSQDLKNLREKIQAPPTLKPEEITARETEWQTALTKELPTVIPIPMLNSKDNKVEKLLDFEISNELRSEFVNLASKARAQLATVSDPAARKEIIRDYQQTMLFANMPKIVHAIKEKIEADTRAAVEAEYDNAGKLRADKKNLDTSKGQEKTWDEIAFGG